MEERHIFEPTMQDPQHCVFWGGELYALAHEGYSWGTLEQAVFSEVLYPFWTS